MIPVAAKIKDADNLTRALDDQGYPLTDDDFSRMDNYTLKNHDPRRGDQNAPAVSDVLMHGSRKGALRDHPTAIDMMVEGRPVKERLAIQKTAKAGGYVRPRWADLL